MSNEPNPSPNQPKVYQIRIKGQLGSQWADWFEGMSIETDDHDTLLTGLAADQAALHGILAKIRDLNLTIISVNYLKPE